jgi:hypothetical protein
VKTLVAAAPPTINLWITRQGSTRKLLINLILTLNNTFADYDFRDLKPEDFVREHSLEMVMNSVNNKISRVDEETNSQFCQRLWSAINSEMALHECDIYSYVADMDDDALSVGKMYGPVLNYSPVAIVADFLVSRRSLLSSLSCDAPSRWSVNYFFYNKKLKKLAFFACWINRFVLDEAHPLQQQRYAVRVNGIFLMACSKLLRVEAQLGAVFREKA